MNSAHSFDLADSSINSGHGFSEGCEFIMWKDIPGFEGLYMISSAGTVKSIRRNKLLTLYFRRGYATAWLCQGSIEKNQSVARAVAIAFIPNPENKPEVNHKDGNKSNNYVSNLEWCNHSENIQHADRTGLRDIKGEKAFNSKLTKDDILKIRSLKGILSQRRIASEFKVARSLIHRVQSKEVWKHI